MNCGQNSNWDFNVIDNLILPFIVAIIIYWIAGRSDENKRRKNNSILGVVIIESLLEEIDTGVKIFRDTINGQTINPMSPPRKSWTGMQTIPDDVLLRIIAVSKKEDLKDHWHPRRIRSHCKNYFEHMCTNWDNAITSQTPIQIIKTSYSNYVEAAEGVQKMLNRAKTLLDNNSKKWFAD
jgi:hypothetical protein